MQLPAESPPQPTTYWPLGHAADVHDALQPEDVIDESDIHRICITPVEDVTGEGIARPDKYRSVAVS